MKHSRILKKSRSRFFGILVAASLATVATRASDTTIPTRLFDPGFLAGDCNYHSLTSASAGILYFTIGTHNDQHSVRIFRFDPATEAVSEVAKLSDALGQDLTREIPDGKIHTPLIEHDGQLYFGTHTSFYDGNLPNMSPADGRAPYSGEHFMRYDLKTGAFEDLAHLQLPNEGIITMAMDRKNETLYGLTWPTGLLLSYNLEEGLLHNWGAVQQRGEWGLPPEDWNFICRRLALDPQGNLFGGTDTGRIWHFESGPQRPLKYYEKLSLTNIAPVQQAGFEIPAEAHFFWNNWRTVL